MKQKNKKKQQKKGKAKNVSKPKNDQQALLLTIGKIDFVFQIDFVDKDLEILDEDDDEEQQPGQTPSSKKDDKKEYYRIENINSISDLHFIRNRLDIWEKIKLVPTNHSLRQLILANRSTKKKFFVDYIGFGRPVFEDDDEYFDSIYSYVTEKYGIFVNRTPLDESQFGNLGFELSYKGKKHFFGVDSSKNKKKTETEQKEPNNDENYEGELGGEPEKSEEQKIKEKEEEAEDKRKRREVFGAEADDYEETQAMKEQKLPKFTRKNTVLRNIVPVCSKYNVFYMINEDIEQMPGDFEMKDLNELIFFLKKKGCKTFINFYQTDKNQEDEEEDQKDEEDKDIQGEHFNSGGNVYSHADNYDAKEGEENQDTNKENETMKHLNNFYYLIDAYFFDSKQACEIFDKHYKHFTSDKEKKDINKSKLIDYFIKGIASGTKDEVDGNKYGFFMDDFVKFSVVHASKKKAGKLEFDCQLHPKINHTNIELIKQYKKLIKKNKDYYISLFIAFQLEGICSSSNFSTEVIYSAFLNALEIIKRKVEYTKNNLEVDEDAIMKYKLSEKALAEALKKLAEGDSENGFVLDCVNKEKSNLKDYVALHDYHLGHYFSSYIIQRDLKNKGFIDGKGYIMYDPVYRGVMSNQIKPQDEKDNDKKVIKSIQKIDVCSRINDKEIVSSKAASKLGVATDKKLPTAKYGVPKKAKKNKKPKAKGDQANGNKGDEGSGEGSGDENQEHQF